MGDTGPRFSILSASRRPPPLHQELKQVVAIIIGQAVTNFRWEILLISVTRPDQSWAGLFAQGGRQFTYCPMVTHGDYLVRIDKKAKTLQTVKPFASGYGLCPLIADQAHDIIGKNWVDELCLCHSNILSME